MKPTEKKPRRNWQKFEEARAFVHSLKLKGKDDWKTWIKGNSYARDIPTNPNVTYKNQGWIGYGDWLGTGRIANFNIIYRPFQEARTFVHSLGLKNGREWTKWAKSADRPNDIPARPDHTYKETGWKNWTDWLGTKYKIYHRRFQIQNARAFQNARIFVHNIGLKNTLEWRKWAKSGDRPDDIPSDPARVYSDDWVGWGDWLGTDHIAPQNRVYLPFVEARAFAHTLGLDSIKSWILWARSNERQFNIPATPDGVYKNQGWKSWGDWLGTNRIAPQNMVYRPFVEARAFSHSIHINNLNEWIEWSKTDSKPIDIPAYPDAVYKNDGWVGWGDWLGTGRIANQDMVYRSFKDARDFVHTIGFQGRNAWRLWAKSDARPNDIPAGPERFYKEYGWAGWGDWLGTGNISPKDIIFRPFEEARTFVHRLGLKNGTEWFTFAKSDLCPSDIPANPRSVYRNTGWKDMGDWLGTGRIAPQNMVYRPFEEARIFAHNLKLKSGGEWAKWAKSKNLPLDIPAGPERVYKMKGWKGWGDWLGTNRIAPKNMVYRPFEEARAFVHALRLKNKNEWITWSKGNDRPIDIPANPSGVYKNKGWISWGDWFGTNRIAPQNMVYRPFEEARTFVRSLGLQSYNEWITWSKGNDRSIDIPANPSGVYKNKGWISWGDWLGTGRIAPQNMVYRPFK